MMKVIYIPQKAGFSGNIIFPKKWPMRGGKFPKDHPCASNPNPFTCIGKQRKFLDEPNNNADHNDPLSKFRKRGHDASCFPEGDGITMLTEKSPQETMDDIRECFGWEVELR
jgi:hypothetical protein